MKNLKRLSRTDLKNLKGGKAYPDMCTPGKGDTCGQYGLSCGIYQGKDNAVGVWSAWRCI
ncbi:bacteriocin-like protein [Elizabethkingia anophelis]|uniref:bacteriocin-like protein n=1 Tax=Elizabethkingia anophelis TaxID=1117645 RepID=UPI000317CB12|nr:hypothetical protein EAAG1_006975 [Elizabethkingia anophelis Ag1]ATC43286.1 hypothetical protein CMV41_06975 [Elizabethkingia anophelis]ATC46962.1 hypothetical protein CMV40_06975 [Elizabethkingia anophelis]